MKPIFIYLKMPESPRLSRVSEKSVRPDTPLSESSSWHWAKHYINSIIAKFISHLVFLVLGEIIRFIGQAVAKQGRPRWFHLRIRKNNIFFLWLLAFVLPNLSTWWVVVSSTWVLGGWGEMAPSSSTTCRGGFLQMFKISILLKVNFESAN